jgi:preprotein translocase subunit SecA
VSLEDDLMRIFGSEKVAAFMDKLGGFKEEDVIEHSWMSKTIERNQRRMEQNNFGIRKRLLEYDDVMNKQRSSIYRIRKNALFGEKLRIDLSNMLMNWCYEVVSGHKQNGASWMDLELEVIRTLAMAPPFTEEEYHQGKAEDLAVQLFEHLNQQYNHKSKTLAEKAYPVFANIRETQGERIENVVVPMTDGSSQFQLTVPMSRALETKCQSMISDFEKSVTLQSIDDEWKEHLRELDELKQSSNNAQYEQKDPLLIYKMESWELYGQMLNRMNHKILGMLFRTRIFEEGEVNESRPAMRKPEPKVVASKEDYSNIGEVSHEEVMAQSAPRIPQNPIRNDMKVGRNDPCPCGSGKKFKQCHGKD